MRAFLLLSIRADDAAADNEYEAFGALAELAEGELRRVRLEQRALGDIDLRDWSGIFLGGGPFNFTDPQELKSPVQRRVEEDLSRLLDGVVAADFPFLGACYGIGALGRHEGAVVDRRYAEPVGTVRVTVTAPGRARIRCWPACPPSSTRSPGTRRQSASCPGTRSCWPPRPAARSRRSGWGPTSTPRSSIRSWTRSG